MLEDNHQVLNDNKRGAGLPQVYTSVSRLTGVPNDEKRFLRILEQIFDLSRQRSAAEASVTAEPDSGGLDSGALDFGGGLLDPLDAQSGSGVDTPGGPVDTEFDESLFE